MKKTTKEVLHTQGEWIVEEYCDGWKIFGTSINFPIAIVRNKFRKHEVNQANAELICKAVNNYQKLLDSNRELVKALYKCTASMQYHNVHETKMATAYNEAVTAINNAKAI